MAQVQHASLGEDVTVSRGDTICFKSDYEQSGVLHSIKDGMLVIYWPGGFGGDYLRYSEWAHEAPDRCWVDDGYNEDKEAALAMLPK